MRVALLVASLMWVGCLNEPEEHPMLDLWVRTSTDTLYLFSASTRVYSDTYTDTLTMPSGRFYSEYSSTTDRGRSTVAIVRSDGSLEREFVLDFDRMGPIKSRFHIDTLTMLAPRRAVVTLEHFTGIVTYRLKPVP